MGPSVKLASVSKHLKITRYKMKKLVLGLLVLASFQEASAKAREFRVITGKTVGDISLAWGVKGQVVDFEAYDAKSEDVQWKFFDDNVAKIENYVVDQKTQKVLFVVRGADPSNNETSQGPIVEFTSMINVNHNSISLRYDTQANVGIVQGSAKWFGGAEKIFALKKNDIGQNEVVGLCDSECEEEIIMPALRAQMTATQLKDYDKYPAKNTNYEVAEDAQGNKYWKVTAFADNPKDDGTCYEASMRLTFAKGKFVAKFGKVVKARDY